MKVSSLKKAYRSGGLMDTKAGLEIQSSTIGWRELFDPYAHEWGTCTIQAKLEMIEKLKSLFNCNFGELIYLYVQDLIDYDKLYRLSAVPEAVYEYSSQSMEAENYLKKCKHPVFLKFASMRDKSWKEAIHLRCITKWENFCDRNSLPLLLV